MKTIAKLTFAISAFLVPFAIAIPAFAQSVSGYEWRSDDSGTYLYVTGNTPIRIYAKDVRDIRIVEEAQNAQVQAAPVQTTQAAPLQTPQSDPLPAAQTEPPAVVSSPSNQTAPQNGVDPLSPFGPREKFLQYYMQLNDTEKRMYETVYFAIKNHEETCHFEEEVDNKARVIWAVYNDHPELFWFDRSYSATTNYGSKTTYDIKLNYIDFKEPFEQSKQKVEAVVNILAEEASKLNSDAEKERFIHDYLVTSTKYDKSCDSRFSEYGALINRCAVCEGISHAFQHIMLKLGIQATYMPGTLTENGSTAEHAWNQIILDGQCYNVDVTGDEFPPDEDFGNTTSLAHYLNFNLSDREFESMGYRRDSDTKGDEAPLPVCKQSAPVENILGLDALIQAYSYFNLNVDSAVKSLDDYYSLMYNEIVQSKSNRVRVFALIKGEKLYSKINDLSMKEKKKGYLTEAWKRAFKDYSSASTSIMTYRVSSNVWFSLTEVTFSE